MTQQSVTDVHTRPKPVVLLILDGWGLSPSWQRNPIVSTKTPTFDYLWQHYPHTVLQSFKFIGSSDGRIRSSEIGHASIGAGRIVKDDLTELNAAIESGQFYENPILQSLMDRAKQSGKALHLIGLLSDGGIQGDINHAIALVKMAKQRGVKELWLHPITDGFDVPNHTALGYLKELQDKLTIEGLGQIGTVIGRTYAMNQEDDWDKTALAYRALLYGEGPSVANPTEAVELAYANKQTDATLTPTVVTQRASKDHFTYGRIKPGDIVVSWNFRHDGIEQLLRSFIDPNVLKKMLVLRKLPIVKAVEFFSLTDYRLNLPNLKAVFPVSTINNILPELIEAHHMTQLRVAEALKYQHVGYFFNGGRVEPFDHEARIIIPSPRVATYAQSPQLSTNQIVQTLEKAIRSNTYDFIVSNLANVDVVAKTGDFSATAKAVQIVDESIRKIANAIIETGGMLIITADHGNAEQLRTTATKNQRHTVSPLPFIMVGNGLKQETYPGAIQIDDMVSMMIRSPHTLADIAPTILELLGIAKPSDMTGNSLIEDISTGQR